MSTEIHVYTKQQIERMVMFAAQMEIIGDCFIGELGEQRLTWLDDGGAEVRTPVTRTPLPPPPRLPPRRVHRRYRVVR